MKVLGWRYASIVPKDILEIWPENNEIVCQSWAKL
jgi:hypothetical protein